MYDFSLGMDLGKLITIRKDLKPLISVSLRWKKPEEISTIRYTLEREGPIQTVSSAYARPGLGFGHVQIYFKSFGHVLDMSKTVQNSSKSFFVIILISVKP